MRFLQLATYYDAYLGVFHRANPDVATLSYEQRLHRLLADGFAGGYVFAPSMRALGCESSYVVANWISGQAQWARENSVEIPEDRAGALRTCVEQVNRFRPDVLFITDPIALDARFLGSLAWKPRLVVAWRQATIPDGTDWRGVDILLSGDDACLRRARELGARQQRRFRPGFPHAIADALDPEPRRTDVVFCGQISDEHRGRCRGLEMIAEAAEGSKGGFSLDFHLLGSATGVLERHNRGALWGMAMYRAIRQGRIGLNFHIDVTGRAMNYRMVETTALGTLLLTEADPMLATWFAPGHEVETYTSVGELIEKARFYLDHTDAREAIARRGRERCLRDSSMEARSAELDRLIQEALR
ncbi:glycosyltransferase family protein [Azospirillum sp. Marseille-Q6669]